MRSAWPGWRWLGVHSPRAPRLVLALHHVLRAEEPALSGAEGLAVAAQVPVELLVGEGHAERPRQNPFGLSTPRTLCVNQTIVAVTSR